MKQTILFFFVITLFSCTADRADIINADSEITFTVPAGKFSNQVSSIKMKGNLAIKTYYSFSGIKAAGELATIVIIADSLQVMKYHTIQGTGSMFSLNNIIYTYVEQGDYIDVTITSYNNGVVNGTFTGKVSKTISLNPLVLEQVTITGEIKNAELKYL